MLRGICALALTPPDLFSLPLMFPAPIRTYESEPDFIRKYKTELCRNWAAGHCEFGPACTFAHGLCELRAKPQSGLIRAKKCKQFLRTGACDNKATCGLNHVAEKQRKRLPVFEAIERKGLI